MTKINNFNNLEIRKALDRDSSKIIEFNQAMAMETENKRLGTDTLSKGVEHLMSHPELGFYLVAEDTLTKSIVGSLMITYEWSDWRASLFLWIQSVYVVPTHRRRGVYKKLYEFVKSYQPESEVGTVCGIRLYVDVHNKNAQKVYGKLQMNHSHYLMYES